MSNPGNHYITGLLLVVFIILMASISLVAAHQPRLVMGTNTSLGNPIIIENPEVSQAFYGQLNGQPDFYKITSDAPFKFYIGLLVPTSPGISPDFISAQLLDSSGNIILTVDGENSTWEPYFEEFGGDYYLKGPEARANLTAGTYYIKIYNTNNQGKYSVAVGEIESFPIDESLKALITIPLLKEQFFEKQVSTLFFQFIGIILALGSIMVLFFMLLRARRSEELTRLTAEVSGVLKPVMWLGIIITMIVWLYVMFKNPFNIEGIVNTILLVIIIILSWNMSNKLSKLEYGKIPLIRSIVCIIMWWIFVYLAMAII
jgi:hypothetical protein